MSDRLLRGRPAPRADPAARACSPRCSRLPLVANDYLHHRADPHPLFRLRRPGLEHHDGLCRPALARPRALRRPRRLCGRRRSTCISASARGSGCGCRWRSRRAAGAVIGFLAFRFGVGGVYFAILTIAFAEFARIGFDHWSWVGGSAGFFLPVANYTRNDLLSLRGSPTMFYYVAAGHDGWRPSSCATRCCAAAPATTGRRSARARRPRRRSASTPSATRCTRWCCRRP